ncbi:MAG: hypothetical protein KA765_01450 [Thermoflexales bacterium]|nr:hypothetical protein [Thermoflexales bacterium]
MKHAQWVIALSLFCVFIALLLTIAPVTQASPNAAVVTNCTDAGLATAVATGGLITFNCNGVNAPATINIVSDKNINQSTTIDGGSNITLTAGSNVRLGYVSSSSVALTLTNLTVANLSQSSSYNSIWNAGGTLVISNVKFLNNLASPLAGSCVGTDCTFTMTVANSQFISNTGSYLIYAFNNPGRVNISSTTFISSNAEVVYVAGRSLTTIEGALFTGTSAHDVIRSDGPTVVSNSLFQANTVGFGTAPIWMTGGTAILTLTGSSLVSNTNTSNFPSAIYNTFGTLYVSNTTFLSNTSTGNSGVIYENAPLYAQILSSTFQTNSGGAISINSASNPLIIADSQFISNTAAGTTGAIYAGTLTVTHSSFIGNVSNGGGNAYSGAIDANNNAYISDSTFLNNRGTASGAVNLSSGTSTARYESVIRSVFKGNVGLRQYAGGLSSSQNLVVIDSEFSDNLLQTNNSGAGLYFAGSTLTLSRTLIYNNVVTGTSGTGGGLYASGAITLVNNTIYSNSASSGGGVYVGGGTLNLTNNTLMSNTAVITTNASNLRAAGTVYLRNNVIAGGPLNCSGTPISVGHNLSSDATCKLTGTLDITNTQPLLEAFANNGGPTFSLMPQASSPLVNMGDNNQCPLDDQRGVGRPIGPACDIGAIESPYLTPQTITFNALPDKILGDAVFSIGATASSGLSVTFTSQTGSVCAVNGNLVSLLNGGLCTLRASQSGNTTYAPASEVDQSFTVLLTQTISFAALPTRTLGDAAFSIAPTASSGLSVTLASQTSNVCAVNGNLVSVLNGGTCTIRASQSGDATYTPAPNVDQSFTVLLTQTIAFAALPDRLITAPPFAITATASSNLPVTFNASGMCAVNDITVTLSGVIGTCTITATQPGNASYAPAPPVAHTFTVAPQLAQTIAFGALPNKVMGDVAFTLTATATSNLNVTFASQTTSVCAVNGNLVSVLNGGTCTIRASQSGDATYAPAPTVDQSFTVFFTQTITFAALPDRLITAPPFGVAPSASSGLSVTVSSLTLDVCTIDNNLVSLIGGGTCTLRATQAGDAVYAAAPNVDRSFMVKLLTMYLPLILR